MARDVVVTGFGLLSALGETPDAWWSVLDGPDPLTARVDSETYKPFHVYPIGDYDLAAQMPKKGDQRQMGPMMRYGAYACGLALESAGIKGDAALLARLELLGAADGGERDWEVDEKVLELIESSDGSGVDPGAELNRVLSEELRPTLFLAQLPNLFGGNMSIVHGVAGATRTFMGEESAGIDVLRIGFERIAAGQGEIFAVGGAFNACRPDLHAMYDAGGLLLAGDLTPVWERPEAGICLGSAGAFVVIESAEHARARDVDPLARLRGVKSDRCARVPGAAAASAGRQLEALRESLQPGRLAVLSGACGLAALAREEHEFLDGLACPVRGTAGALGHTVEAAFIANLILGVSCLQRGKVFGPLAPEETTAGGEVGQVLVTGWGPFRGEGMALLEAIE